MTMDNNELKPCPFCGEPAKFEDGGFNAVRVACSDFDCEQRGRVHKRDKNCHAKLAARWNTRVSSTAPVVDHSARAKQLVDRWVIDRHLFPQQKPLTTHDIRILTEWIAAALIQTAAASPAAPVDHDSCSHWREGDSDNCVWCGDDLGPTTIEDVAPQADVEVLPVTRIVHPFSPCGYKYCDWPDGELRCNEPRSFPAAPTPSQPARDAEEFARQIVGTVFDNTAASHETLKQTMIERITSALPAAETEIREALEGMVAAFDNDEGDPQIARVTRQCAMSGAKRVLGWDRVTVDSTST